MAKKKLKKFDTPVVLTLFARHRRPKNAQDLYGRINFTTTFRPHLDLLEDFAEIVAWTKENHSNVSAVFNSLIPAIRYMLENAVFIDKASGKRYMRADFGDILLRGTVHPNHEID